MKQLVGSESWTEETRTGESASSKDREGVTKWVRVVVRSLPRQDSLRWRCKSNLEVWPGRQRRCDKVGESGCQVTHCPDRILCADDVKVTWKHNPEITRTRTSYCKSPAGCVKYVHDALVFCHLSSWILCLLYHHLSMYIYMPCISWSLGLVFLFLVSL
jgi:hypothetical protein